MWKWKEDEKPAAAPEAQPRAAAAPPAPAYNANVVAKEVRPVEAPKPVDNFRTDVAHIGKSVVVRGELSGSEDLYLDGEVEGSIELHGHSLIIGPNGRVRASVHARDVVIHGKVNGNIQGTERVELKKSAVLAGDIVTQRIVIEDGAYFKGGIDIQRETAKPAAKEATPEPKREAIAATAGQGSLLETKK